MAKVSTPNCGTCGKPSEVVILWLKSGDTEWTCIECHLAMVLAMVAEQTDVPAESVPQMALTVGGDGELRDIPS